MSKTEIYILCVCMGACVCLKAAGSSIPHPQVARSVSIGADGLELKDKVREEEMFP